MSPVSQLHQVKFSFFDSNYKPVSLESSPATTPSIRVSLPVIAAMSHDKLFADDPPLQLIPERAAARATSRGQESKKRMQRQILSAIHIPQVCQARCLEPCLSFFISACSRWNRSISGATVRQLEKNVRFLGRMNDAPPSPNEYCGGIRAVGAVFGGVAE